ncbi:MAG: S-layer homology domain-containing protein [Clostridia bacterium]|nr:S-layer homology domain-containing protein [Clostridia bacterium]
MKKRILSLVMAALMLIGSLSVFVFTAFAANEFTLTVKSGMIEDDGTVRVYINAKGVKKSGGFAALGFRVYFDNDEIVPIGYVRKNVGGKTAKLTDYSDYTTNLDESGNYSKLSFITCFVISPVNFENDGTLMAIDFKVLDDDLEYSEIRIEKVDCANDTRDKISPKVVNGAVSIDYKALKENADTIKYMDGRGEKFEPQAFATRYEVVDALYNVFDITSGNIPENFSDVDNKHKDVVAVLTAAEIIDGYPSDNTFRGEKTITRAEFCKIVTVLLDLDTDSVPHQGFNDVKNHPWAGDYINACAKAGLVEGKGNGRFDPEGNIRRGELATIINRITGAKPGTECKYPDLDANDPAQWYFGAVAAAAR